MKFTHRAFNLKADEAIYREFANKCSQLVPDKIEFLAPTGLIVFCVGMPIAMGFLIKCDNGIAIAADFMSDPDYPDETRSAAVQYLREELYADAVKSGIRHITCIVRNEKLAKRLEAVGYERRESGYIQLGRNLWP